MALKRKWMPSPNYSSRGGAGVRLIVIHTAEGALSIESLGNFFASSSAGVSSQVGVDDTPNTVGEYVKRGNKAWTQANANPYCVSAELCAFASWSKGEWDKHPTMLENTAKWIAEEAAKFGLPIVRLNANQAQGSGRGVCSHKDLGSWGGGHWDPGDSFPWDKVLDMAKSGGEMEDEMGYPKWFWDWVKWMRDGSPDGQRPDGAPDKIPEWAWDGWADVEGVGKGWGMSDGERDWIVWREQGSDPAERPDVPDSIPDRWWPDNDFVIAQGK